MSHRQNAATTELLRLFKGPKELHASGSGKVAERLPLAYDVALHRMVERGLKASDSAARRGPAPEPTSHTPHRRLHPEST
jgi:hypothetical protein